MFEPGAKVVCIDDVFNPEIIKLFNLVELPKLNEVYTVRDILPGINPNTGNETVSVYLEELRNNTNDIDNKTNQPVLERGFACNRFRELEELEETVSISIKKQEPVLV